MQNSIQTVRDLNIFAAKQGARTPREIIKSLSGSQVIVSHQVARLIAKAFAS